MHQRHNRKIVVDKEKLIAIIKTNKENHIKEYNEAVEAYRTEANRQLGVLKSKLDEGALNIQLKLTTPINREEEYDKVIEMFNWEVLATVELTQDEFNDYVHDDNDQARNAKFSNMFYSSPNG
jgi:hypothetical protein